jgi:hypothetical protein
VSPPVNLNGHISAADLPLCVSESANNLAKIGRELLKFLAVFSGSVLAGFSIGTLQHFVSFGIWGYGFSKDTFGLALIEGGMTGVVAAIPTGLLIYYFILKRNLTFRELAIIVLGSLAGGCVLGAALFWPSAFLTPVWTVFLSIIVRARTTAPISANSVRTV